MQTDHGRGKACTKQLQRAHLTELLTLGWTTGSFGSLCLTFLGGGVEGRQCLAVPRCDFNPFLESPGLVFGISFRDL